MNFKQINEKTKKIIQKCQKKSVEVRKNNTVSGVLKSNVISKNSVEKQKNKNQSPEVKSSVIIKTEQSQTKENVISPKQTTSNYINFTKRSINIKQIQTNHNEVSKESNIFTNHSAHRNIENNLKSILSADKNKLNFSKISATVSLNTAKPNNTNLSKESKRPFDKQLTFIKTIGGKDNKLLMDGNRTIDLTTTVKIGNLITTPHNKIINSKEHESKPVSAKHNENKSSLIISVKNGKKLNKLDTITTCTDTDTITKKASSNVSSINSKKATGDSNTKSNFNLINNLKNNKTISNTSKEKSNEKSKLIKINTNQNNQLLSSKSKNNIKNVKIDIHKKEINLVSSSIVKIILK